MGSEYAKRRTRFIAVSTRRCLRQLARQRLSSLCRQLGCSLPCQLQSRQLLARQLFAWRLRACRCRCRHWLLLALANQRQQCSGQEEPGYGNNNDGLVLLGKRPLQPWPGVREWYVTPTAGDRLEVSIITVTIAASSRIMGIGNEWGGAYGLSRTAAARNRPVGNDNRIGIGSIKLYVTIAVNKMAVGVNRPEPVGRSVEAVKMQIFRVHLPEVYPRSYADILPPWLGLVQVNHPHVAGEESLKQALRLDSQCAVHRAANHRCLGERGGVANAHTNLHRTADCVVYELKAGHKLRRLRGEHHVTLADV